MEFMLGCNYWASNAGTEMWVQWDEEAVKQDLEQLSAHGLKYLRVFPNWRDFQPVCAFYGYANRKKEYRHKDGSFFDNPYYIDMEMMRRFNRFCEIAAGNGMKLIVGLLTGWMSGRTFTPPVLEGKDLYTDATARMLEQRFIKGFVSQTYKNEAIYAWDLGNECNCFSEAESREAAADWTAMVTNAIRANDPTGKLVVSGMHGLSIDEAWNVFDQGEETDILTTHPYPHFVEYCSKDHMTSFRTLLHATCEGKYYSDLGGKPCLTEEIGTLGPMTCDDETGSGFLKTNLYSNWANGSLGLLWWCGCEQVLLRTAPYTWCMMERELGLMDAERKPRKTLKTIEAFSKWLEGFGRELPKAKTDAVCILTKDQPHWGTAYMTYALAKQAHVNLRFAYSEQRTIPESPVYLMPSISGTEVCCKETFDVLLQRVWEGATLYISNADGYLAEFEKISGVHVINSMRSAEEGFIILPENGRDQRIAFRREKRTWVEARAAQVLASDSLGIPAFTKHSYGKGCVYYVNFPLETMLLDESFAFAGNRHLIYDEVFREVKREHPVSVANPFVGMTCHRDENLCCVVLINYTDEAQETGLKIHHDYLCEEVYGGFESDGNTEFTVLPPHEAAILMLRKK